LSISPQNSVTIDIVASPELVFNPTSFTFNTGQSPYSLAFTVTSTEPGTYYVTLAYSGLDANNGLVSPTPVNVTYYVYDRMFAILFHYFYYMYFIYF
jgi:hypothetical protein